MEAIQRGGINVHNQKGLNVTKETMVTLDETKNWFADIWSINVSLNIAINNCKRMTLDMQGDEAAILHWGFFQHHLYQLKFIAVIQLAKLFSDSRQQKRSIARLCTYLADDKYSADFGAQLLHNQQIDPDVEGLIRSRADMAREVSWVRTEIMSHQKIVNKITTARDKIYAHHDPGSNVEFIRFDELKTMKDLVSQIYNRLHGKLFGVTTNFATDDWSINTIVRNLVDNTHH